jgi:hypothetical protein
MNRKSAAVVVGLLTGAVVFLTGTAATAAPVSGPSVPSPFAPVTVSAPMIFHYDAAIAAAHGYTVRTLADGYQYAVPTGTPADSTVGATPIAPPADSRLAPASALATPDTSPVAGDCGTSFVKWTSLYVFETGYSVAPTYGYAISQVWFVAVDTNYNTTSYDLSGLAPAFSLSWHASRTVSFKSIVYTAEALAGGETETDFGECESAGPSSYDQYL